MAITKNTATPNATASISVRLGTDGTCCARTCKSGSEMVITNPIINEITTITNTLLDRVIMEPTFSPMGVIDNSTPTLKNNIPTINKVAPIKNVIRTLGGIGAMEKHKSNTINKLGTTAFSVSENFYLKLDLNENNIYNLFLIHK